MAVVVETVHMEQAVVQVVSLHSLLSHLQAELAIQQLLVLAVQVVQSKLLEQVDQILNLLL